MSRPPVLALAAVAVLGVAALFARAGTARDAAGFRTPDAGAACRLERAALVCSSLGSPSSLVLRPGADVRAVRRLPWWDASTPVLERWHHGPLRCALRATTIVCRHGATTITIGRAGYTVAV